MKKMIFSLMILLVNSGFAVAEDVKIADVQNLEQQQSEDMDYQGRRFRRRRFQADGEEAFNENDIGRRGGFRRRATAEKGQLDAKQRKYRRHNPELRKYFEKYPDVREDLERNRELWKDLSLAEKNEQCRLWKLRNPQAAELMTSQIAGQECIGMGRSSNQRRGGRQFNGKGNRGGNGRRGQRRGAGFQRGAAFEPITTEETETKE